VQRAGRGERKSIYMIKECEQKTREKEKSSSRDVPERKFQENERKKREKRSSKRKE